MGRIALVFALLGSMLFSPLAESKAERFCEMGGGTPGQASPAMECQACCGGAMPCCESSKNESPQPQPLSNEQGRSYRQLFTAPLLPLLLPSWCLPPPSGVYRPLERRVCAFSRIPRAAISCIWLI